MARTPKCTHLDTVKAVVPSGEGCQECLAMGDTWVHLRLCRSCGHVGCWCFVDELEVFLT